MKNLLLFIFCLFVNFGFAQNHFTESFESVVSGSWSGYTTGTITFASGDWDFFAVFPETSSGSHDGSKACRINDDVSGASITAPSVNGVGTVSFYYHRPYSGTGDFELQKSVGGGAFTTLATVNFDNVTSPTLYSYDVNDPSNDIRIRILNDDNSAHLTIDLVTIGQSTSSSPLVGFDAATSSETETNATFATTIPVTMSNYGGSQVDLNVAVTGGTADMADYTLNTSSLSFTADGTQNVSIDINPDADIIDETIEITITETTATGATVSPSVHTITVTDDDATSCTAPVWTVVEETLNSQSDTWTESSGDYSVNGYVGSASASDLWLVYGPLDMSSTSVLNFTFDLAEDFGGNNTSTLDAFYTESYTGTPSDTGNNWVTVANLLTTGDDTESGVTVDFAGSTDTDVYIAFQYTADGLSSGSASLDLTNITMTADVCPTISACAISNVMASATCNGDDADVTVTWTEVGSSGTIEVDINGNGYETMNSGDVYTITGPTVAATGLIVTVRDTNDVTCSATTTVDIPECPVGLPDLVINEILADPDGSTGDANGDGIVSTTQDEFVEIINISSGDLDISGYTLADGNSVRHTFPVNTILPAGTAITVFGGGTPTGINGIAQTASSGLLGLNNSGDDITINDGISDIITVSYGSEGGNDQSLARSPDYSGSFVQHSTIATNPVDFSPGRLNADNTALPVELLHFTAKANNNAAILTWATASEENNAYFDVQRSTDGINFETIGQVEGAGTTYDVQEYTFIDESPVNGINYYRLRQVDIDGQFEFHKIEVVTINGLKNGVVIVPTQVCNQFDVVFGETIDATVEMNIVSVNGQTVKSEVININGNHQTINVSELNVGVYFIRMNVNNTIVTKRFVKL